MIDPVGLLLLVVVLVALVGFAWTNLWTSVLPRHQNQVTNKNMMHSFGGLKCNEFSEFPVISRNWTSLSQIWMLTGIAKTSLYYRNVSINFLASHKSSEIRYLSPLQTTSFPFISFLWGSKRLRLLGPLLDPDRVGAVDSDGADHLARGRHLSNVLRKCWLKSFLEI